MGRILTSVPRKIMGAAFILSFVGFILFLGMDSFYRGPILTVKDLSLLKALTLGLWAGIVLMTLLLASKEQETAEEKKLNGCLRIFILLILGSAILLYVLPTLLMEFTFAEFVDSRGLKVFAGIIVVSILYGIFSGNPSGTRSGERAEPEEKKEGQSYDEQKKRK